MKYFDAHAHPNFAAYGDDRAEVIARAKEAEVGINAVGTQLDTSKEAVALAERYDNVWATIGLHPIHTAKSYHDEQEVGVGGGKPAGGFTSRGEVFDQASYEEIGRHPRVIAIGECGLDYYRVDKSTKDAQVRAFMEQIELANRLGKPLMLHVREAYDDALDILEAHVRVRGNAHFFAGGWEVAKRFLSLGFTLSFTGVITFTHDYDEVVKSVPADMMLSETDAPYVAPVPHRGRRNEPIYVERVVQRIADIRGEHAEEVRVRVLANAERLFGIRLA